MTLVRQQLQIGLWDCPFRGLAQDRYSGLMHKSWSPSAKLGAIGGLLLGLALFSIGLTLWVTWHLEGGAAAVNEAGRMRMQT